MTMSGGTGSVSWKLRLTCLVCLSSASCEKFDRGNLMQTRVLSTSASSQPQPRSSKPSVVAFLRIQKTGGTTFGEVVGRTMAEKNGQTFWGRRHFNYNNSVELAPDGVVTLLRDPAERLISEFQMLRTAKFCERCQDQDQWDWHPDDLEWLHRVRGMHNVTEAFIEYLRSPNNPARNRQSLYLLGFHRAACGKRPCYFPEPSERKGYPAHEYDWDKDHETLLTRAKSHLMSLRSFGITDCYLDSMEVFARAVGWDPKDTRELAEKSHAQSGSQKEKASLVHLLGLQPEPAHPALLQQHTSIVQQLSLEIARVNKLDVELLEFARQQWYNLHGSKCERKA
eukprot:TRINITY_DN21311_c0_g1_i1.p1 TRINITY_DN21311_c0_g1~~TRINITY_DN21311_c0_g1_i1.p1  ORF type:complete len:339 (-),score=52.80 TRINITY_DN21311_c0_g1_i1:73-1089(-)